MTRGRRLWLFSTTGALLTLGCLVLLNLLAARFHARADFSDGDLYSLSAGSKRILREMDAPVEISVYFSKKLPPEYEARRGYIKDLLQEYREASRSKVTPRIIDVDQDAEAKRRALSEGIAPVEFNIITQEKFEVTQGFMGLVLRRDERKEVIPVIVGTEGLEYDLTSRILQLIRKKKDVIGFLSSHGALGPENLHPRVREWLERNYELRPIDLRSLTPGATIAAEVSALFVLGPTETFPDYHLYTLDQFLLSGRPMAVGADARRADMKSFISSPLDTGLDRLLRHHGLGPGKSYVLDAQNQKVQISRQQGWVTYMNIVEYPLFVVSTELDGEHPVTRHLKSLTLPLTSAVEISTRAPAARYQALARSSKYSWRSAEAGRGSPLNLSPLQSFKPKENDEKGPFVLAAAAHGPFTSYFSSEPDGRRPIPKGADRAAHRAQSGDGARLVVAGTSRFAHPDMPVGESGPAFLLNLADWMALDADLIAIRAKGILFRPLREIPPSAKRIVRWINIFGPIFFVTGFGFLRLRLRAAARRRRVNTYSLTPSD
ncbi:MAG: GldG family protein [Elusimicrobiota bacterium]